MQIVDHREVLRAIAAGARVADVLPSHEYRSTHIRGAIHLSMAKLIHKAEHALDKREPVVVYCRDSL